MPDLSAIVVVKNRSRQLKISIQSWLMQDDIKEIVIVDCDSNDLDKEYFKEISQKIKIIKSKDPEFHYTRALNIGINNAEFDHVVKLDVDHIINPYFSLNQWVELDWQNEFITGSTHKSDDLKDLGMLTYLNSFLIIKKQHLLDVGGYDTNLVGYGWESNDLKNRLILDQKLIKKLIPITDNFVPVYHNPHTNHHRTLYSSTKDVHQSILNNIVKSKYKRII